MESSNQRLFLLGRLPLFWAMLWARVLKIKFARPQVSGLRPAEGPDDMADGQQLEEAERELPGGSSPSPLPRPPPFLEVLCKSSGKVRRFAAGTEAGSALYLINRKLDFGLPQALYIEAVKEGEEPVSFGPNAVLVNYGDGWRLQTIIEEDYGEARRVKMESKPPRYGVDGVQPHLTERRDSKPSSSLSPRYVGKILLAFVFMFLLGGVLTLFLETLPSLISVLSPSS